MMRFVFGEAYTAAVRELISDADSLQIAVAFWGHGFEEMLSEKSNATLICNLESGATNPKTVRAIYKRINVYSHPRLHAKVLLSEKKAIVGSANLSTNGLNLEAAEAHGWEEAGIVCADPLMLATIRSWFDSLLKSVDVHKVEKHNIDAAQDLWDERCRSRPGLANKDFVETLQQNPGSLRGRDLYFVIWHDQASQEAEEHCLGLSKTYNIPNLDFYEDWPTLPKKGYFIDVKWDPSAKRKPLFQGYYKRDGKDSEFKRGRNIRGTLQLCTKETPRGFKLSKQRVNSWLASRIHDIWEIAEGDNSARHVSVDNVITKFDVSIANR